MPVNFPHLEPALAVPGFYVGTASCGVTLPDCEGPRQDIVLIVSDVPCHAAAVFTQNQIRAVSVTLGEDTIAQHASDIRVIVAWAGNSNAGASKSERQWTKNIIRFAADAAGVNIEQVLSAWTGICDAPLATECIRLGMQQAASSMHHNHWEKAANFIRTSDIFPKYISAMGNSGVKIDIDTISLKADQVTILEHGELHSDYHKKYADAVFAQDEFTLDIHLGSGDAHATIWTCDMTHDFITLGHSDIGPFNPQNDADVISRL